MSIETRLRETGPRGSGGGGSSNSGGLAGTGGFYVTWSADPLLTNEKILTAGSNVTLTTDATTITISASTGAAATSGGLMGTANFLVVWSSDPLLSNEKIFTAGSSTIVRTDATAIYVDATTANALAFVLTSRAINTTYPLTGGGTLAADRTISADTAFLVTSNRNINTTFPLAGGGNLGADRTLTVNTAFFATSASFYVTYSQDNLLSNEKVLTAGSSVIIRTDAGAIYIDAQTGGGGVVYAPTGGFYVAWSSDPVLSNEKIITAGSNITITTSSTAVIISADTGAGSGAPTGAYYFVQSGHESLTNEIVMTSGQQAYITLNPQQAKLYASTSSARIDAGTPNFRLLYSATTQQFGIYHFQMPMDYGSAPLLRLLFGSDSTAAVAQSAFWKIDTWGVSPGGSQLGAYQDTFGGVNTGSVNLANPWTAGNIVMLTIPLATVVSFGANNLIRLRISGSAGGGLVGNLELLGATFEYMKQ